MFGFDGAALAVALVSQAAAMMPGPAPSVPEPVLEAIWVPPALARRTATLEPSGVVWARGLDRYLIVSDDTGSETDHHQPWLLAMSRSGAFDEAVVPLLGIDALNDAESICAGPEEGTFFIATSHSPNRKGRTPEARRMLLLTRLAGRALRVEGRVDLTTARDRGGAGLLQLAGLPADGRLDIEAITFHDGALLIGLKSPLSARNAAVVLRFQDPLAALRAGTIPPGAVTRAWEVALSEGGGIPRGIADLTTLPDGTLIVVANAPKGRTSDNGGAVFSLRDGGPAQLLHWFAHQRPEGATLAADGTSLIVVFDNHEKPPTWARLPLPAAGAAVKKSAGAR